MLSDTIRTALHQGLVIPAHPLAITSARGLDERRQRALTRYYHAAGAGGVAVGVHTTQFEIRHPKHALFEPVLELAAETVRVCDAATQRNTVLIAGICGPTPQAVVEASRAREFGYHLGLLSLAALPDADEDTLIEHATRVSEVIPLFGFYLQPAVGGRLLSASFWRRFASIPNVEAIKVAPFNRYQTWDVVRGVLESGRHQDIALYTGNDDQIVLDLLSTYTLRIQGDSRSVRFVGGLLGHWAVGTQRAVEAFGRWQSWHTDQDLPRAFLQEALEVTDCNAALFDVAHGFRGCIAGIHEVLRRQGLLANRFCLDPEEDLSLGQAEAIDRILTLYPHWTDDAFIAAHRDEWLR